MPSAYNVHPELGYFLSVAQVASQDRARSRLHRIRINRRFKQLLGQRQGKVNMFCEPIGIELFCLDEPRSMPSTCRHALSPLSIILGAATAMELSPQ